MSDEPVVYEGQLLRPHLLDALNRAVFRMSSGRRKPVKLFLDDGVLSIGAEVVPESDYAFGYIHPVAGREVSRVVLLDAAHRTTVDVELESNAEAEELFEALGLSTDRRAAPFTATWIPGAMAGMIAIIVAVCSVALAYQSVWLATALGLALLVLGVLALRTSRYPIMVAPDGVILERPGRHKHIDYADIESVRKDADTGVIFKLRDGTYESITMEHDAGGQGSLFGAISGGGAPLNEAVVTLVRSHLDARERGVERLGERLARRGRDVSKWLDDVDRLVSGDYREEAPTRHQLWQVVENGAAKLSARAAAAHLLRPEGVELDRLRIVVDNAASPKLRIALDAVAEDDAEAEREALAHLDR